MDQPKSTATAIRWVFLHMPQGKTMSAQANAVLQAELKTAPDGAAPLLEWARDNKNDFYTKVWLPIAKQQVEQEAKVSDGGEPVLQIIEKLEAALEPMSPPECADGLEGQPGLPQEALEISSNEF